MPPLKLEVFETEGKANTSTVVMETSFLEETRLASYETGYAAGWEDAVAAQTQDDAEMRAGIGRNLQALSFTYHEARIHVLKALTPLLTEMVDSILPEIARETLASQIVEVLMPLAEEMADAPVTLRVNPSSRAAVETLLDQATGLPVTIIDEPTLGAGQAYLRLGDSETRVDLDSAISAISEAVFAFFDLTEKDRKHG